MNWTGGSLQRTKHANKGVLQKQKAYFARARTKLQQGPNSSTAPFRPDFLRDSDRSDLGHRVASSPSGALRHAGYSIGKRAERGRSFPFIVEKRQGEGDRGTPQEASIYFWHDRHSDEGEGDKQSDKRSKNAPDSETQLLEANKKRLLRQQDWVGIAPSKPVELQYSSMKDKARTGKRRKLDGKSRAVTCRLKPITFPYGSGQNDRVDTFMSGALPVPAVANNVRIRIGSDALTTAASTQPINCAASQANSDSMLFDEEANGAIWQKESEAPQEMPSSGHRLATNTQSTANQAAEPDRSCSPQHDPPAYHDLWKRQNAHADERIRHVAADAETIEQSVQCSDTTHPSYRLTHHWGGIEHPLKLIFSPKCSSRIEQAASPTRTTGKAQRVHANFDAAEIETRHRTQDVGEAHQIDVRRHPNPPPIDGDEPWKTYLDTGVSSSGQASVDSWTGTGALQPHIPARNARAESTSWPQHTAHDKLTHANLLTVSASLPASNRPGVRRLDARPLPRADAIKGFGTDEAFWKSCALGSDPQSAIKTIHSHDKTSEDSMSRATKRYASTGLPLSIAVTSVSSTPFPSTPFRSLSRQASRISNDVQYAPRSESRSIYSAAPSCAMWGGAELPYGEDVPDEKQGKETSAGSHFGEQSTYASLQNHASSGNDKFSDTRTSRSDLARRGRAQDDVSRRAQASGSIVWQRDQGSSIWDNADSDATGIDLIDADRLT